jgi:hypothetical protein
MIVEVVTTEIEIEKEIKFLFHFRIPKPLSKIGKRFFYFIYLQFLHLINSFIKITSLKKFPLSLQVTD